MSVLIGGNQIEFVDQFVHLGHVINSKMNDCDDISHIRYGLIGQTNNVLCDFSCVGSAVRYKLFKSFLTFIRDSVYRFVVLIDLVM